MSPDAPAADFCGVVLAGGTAARMGGIDKAALEVDGRTMLELAVAAFRDAAEVVVAGPEVVRTGRPVTFVREDPPLGGPVAGLLTAVDHLRSSPTLIGVLAVDMPRVTPDTFQRLRAAAAGHDGAFLAGRDGRRQLAGVLGAGRLAEVRRELGNQHGMAMHRLLARLDLALVPTERDEGRDVDTWADLADVTDRAGADDRTRRGLAH